MYNMDLFNYFDNRMNILKVSESYLTTIIRMKRNNLTMQYHDFEKTFKILTNPFINKWKWQNINRFFTYSETFILSKIVKKCKLFDLKKKIFDHHFEYDTLRWL